MQTKQQERAKFALDKLLPNGAKFVNHDFAQFVVGMPNMILSNGIGQTMAFLLAKRQDRMGEAFGILKDWLQKAMPDTFPEADSSVDFLRKFTTISQSEYLQAQHECLKLVEWLKRYARAFDNGGK